MHPLSLAIALVLAPVSGPDSNWTLPTLDEASTETGMTSREELEKKPAVSIETVRVRGFRGERAASPKYTRPLKDTPRIITVLPALLLEKQGTSTLRDALRNIPGISLQAGEGNPPGGDQLKLRGFNARDDLNVNGTRDLGNYFRDPFYVEQIEVVKGPNSAFGGRGSAGGTINFVTKLPQAESFARVEAGVGSDGYRRTTLDLNRALDANSGLRVNLMAHDAHLPGRDVAHEQRFGLYAAYAWGLEGDTRLHADVLHVRHDDLPDAGLPLDRDPRGAHARGTGMVPTGLDFGNFYGHTDDYRKVDVTQLGFGVDHRLAGGAVLRNSTRLSEVGNDSITSSPRIRDIPAASAGFQGARARGDTKPRDQVDLGVANQTSLQLDFETGDVRHDLVTGVDFGRYSYTNLRRPDVNGPLTDLFDPQPRNRPVTPYDGTRYRLDMRELGVYVLDTLAFSPQWELNLGLRWDRVEATAKENGRERLPTPGDNRYLTRSDSEWSGSAGLVYKATPQLSLYASAGTAFEISGNFDRNQVQLAGGATARVADAATFNIAAEKTTAYELGAKWQVGAGLDINAALFETRKDDARFPGQAGGDNSILDAKLRVRGFELLTAGRLTEQWQLYMGYAYLQSKVLAAPSRPFAVGQPLGGTPEHSFNLFTAYDLTPALSLGGGVQYVGDHFSGVQATATGTRKIAIPAYTVAELYARYRFSPALQLRVNAFNVADREYLSQVAEGGGQGIPGRGRQVVTTLRYDF